MGSPRQEYWSGLPFPLPSDLPDPRIKAHLLHWRQIPLSWEQLNYIKDKQPSNTKLGALWTVPIPGSAVGKNPPVKAGDARNACLISGLVISPGGRNGDLLQYSYLETSMDRWGWQSTVNGTTNRHDWAHRKFIISLKNKDWYRIDEVRQSEDILGYTLWKFLTSYSWL